MPRYKAHSPIVIHIPGYARLRHVSMRACHLMHFQTQTAFRVLENALVISGIFHENHKKQGHSLLLFIVSLFSLPAFQALRLLVKPAIR
ncbi:hypothetical protein BFS10_13585 [Brucella suis]|nr:hypothetical protein BFS10_13585 [Brucella suis]